MAGTVASAPLALESLISLLKGKLYFPSLSLHLSISPFFIFFFSLILVSGSAGTRPEHDCRASAGAASRAAQERSAFLAGLWSFTLK